VVTLVFRRSGEAVVAGEPILRITAPKAERLVGYLRQPIAVEPKVGMTVEIRSRAKERQSAESKIVHVSPGMEALTPTLISALHLPPTPLPEPGLRIQVAIPNGFAVRPGEFVDVVVP
jgi:multidrug resistance efflux pump